MGVVVHALLSTGKSSFVSKYNENMSSFYLWTRDFVTQMIVRLGRNLSLTATVKSSSSVSRPIKERHGRTQQIASKIIVPPPK
ncbi:hypothetical protein TNCV_2999861 [Trichonephila clavipes]|nr:hypothetical protein TNCV_2999861 [Trichonephila clavipes]